MFSLFTDINSLHWVLNISTGTGHGLGAYRAKNASLQLIAFSNFNFSNRGIFTSGVN